MPLDPIPGVPAIPQPGETFESLVTSVNALKQAVENMSGQIGDPLDRVVTFRDLIRLNLISVPAAASSTLGTQSRMAYLTEADLQELRNRISALDGLPP
jgi:hypothetical protein